MSTLSSALANQGPPVVWTDPDTGKVYNVSRVTQNKKVEFTDWLEQRARDLLAEKLRSKRITRAAFDEARNELDEDIIACKYDWESRLVYKSLNTPVGSTQFAAFLFGCSYDEMRNLLERREPEVMMLLSRIRTESQPARQVEGAEGNALPPEGAATASEANPTQPTSTP